MAKPSILWTYLLPFLHLSVCLTIALAKLQSGVHYLIYLDFPFSFLPVVLGWRNDNFLLWFAILGTLWWYFLSWAVYSRLWKSD